MFCKLPQDEKPAEPGTYLCMWCDNAFHYEEGQLACSKCMCGDPDYLIPIYRESNMQEQAMYCPIDWHGG